ncbi:MAG: hypothetical protein DMG53_13300 [Acidobacteria bacterium]|nr:MAG: hypothetical protein DMG53_13300 [Acidobacteriota bacterium]PYU77379.1 MAG: hypothetical protein DMG52_00635 [Acidobacteriota bacterium]
MRIGPSESNDKKVVAACGSADSSCIGASGFTAGGWEGSFYPPGRKPAEYLSYYATKFEKVELDNTFHRMIRSLDRRETLPAIMEQRALKVGLSLAKLNPFRDPAG